MPRFRLNALHPPLLAPVDLAIDDGECLTLHGPSGSGKTLLLRAAADLDPHRGEAFIDDLACGAMAAHEWRRRVAYVPAESHWWLERVGDHFAAEAGELLAKLGFEAEVMDWTVTRLSSGERQRLALARTLCQRPEALLLDEVSANLDAPNTARVEALIGEQLAQGLPVLWVSHDPAQRARVSHRCFAIRDGRVEEDPCS